MRFMPQPRRHRMSKTLSGAVFSMPRVAAHVLPAWIEPGRGKDLVHAEGAVAE